MPLTRPRSTLPFPSVSATRLSTTSAGRLGARPVHVDGPARGRRRRLPAGGDAGTGDRNERETIPTTNTAHRTFSIFTRFIETDGILDACKELGCEFEFVAPATAEATSQIPFIEAGDIGAAVGFKDIKTGDTLCDEKNPIVLEAMNFPETFIGIAIVPKPQADLD